MLVGIFKSNYPSLLAVLFVLGGLLWLDAFIHPVNITDTGIVMPLYHLVYDYLNGLNLLSVIIAYLLIYLEAVILNSIVSDNNIITRNTYLPALIYVILMSSTPKLLTLHPVIFANIFLLFAISRVFSLYEEEGNVYQRVFTTGLLTAIASLFYLPSVFFVVIIWIGFLIYRTFEWRQWIISILGFITPYLYLTVYYFWFDKLKIMIEEYSHFFHNLKSISLLTMNTFTYISLGVLLILALLSLNKIFSRLNERVVKERKFIAILGWLFILSTVFLFFAGNCLPVYIGILIIPVSIFIANYFFSFRKGILAELSFTLVLMIVLLNKFL